VPEVHRDPQPTVVSIVGGVRPVVEVETTMLDVRLVHKDRNAGEKASRDNELDPGHAGARGQRSS
jgi:hypothetical protein